jgi:hypothetical protein
MLPSIKHPASSIEVLSRPPVLPSSRPLASEASGWKKNRFNHPFLSVIRGQEDGREDCKISRAAQPLSRREPFLASLLCFA